MPAEARRSPDRLLPTGLPASVLTSSANKLLQTAIAVAHGHRDANGHALDAQTPSTPPAGGQQHKALLERALVGPWAAAALQFLHDQGLLAQLLPELTATIGFDQEIDRHHKDVWAHTKQVVSQATARAAVRWAALLHDVGKVPTRAISEAGKVTFHGHPEASARLFDGVVTRLGFEPEEAQRVRFLIEHHQRANDYSSTWTDSAVRRFAREAGPYLEDLLALSRADVTSAFADKRERAARQLSELEARISAVTEQDNRQPPLPSGIGRALIEHLGLEPGPAIGQLKRALEQRVESGELEPHREAEYYLAALASDGQAV